MRKALFGLILLVLVAGGGYLLYTHEKPADFSGYEEIRVEKGEIVESVEATGVVKPSIGAEVTIGARMSGIVVEEPVKVGDRVKKGDLIARIDDREAKAALDIANEELAKLREGVPKEIARLHKVVERREIGVKEANATLEAALSEMVTARWICNNRKRLFEHKSGPEREYRTACNSYVVKRIAWKNARHAYERARISLMEARLALEKAKSDYRHSVKIAQEKVREAEIRLSYSVIQAPFDGIVTYVSTQKGETVVAGLNAPKFVKILDPEAIENRVYVDETEIGRVAVGMRVTFHVDGYPDTDFVGKIVQIYPQPEIQNGIVYYIAVVKGFGHADLLRPDMTTHDTIVLDVKKDVVRVPNGAVKFKEGRFFVYRKRDGEVTEVPVKTGVSDRRYTEIVEGVSVGETILTEPVKRAD